MLPLFFPQEYLFCEAGRSVNSSVSLIKKDCSLQIIKLLTTLHKIIFTETINELCIETVHVVICETK